MATPRIRRIAENEAAFRDLNESLERSVHRGRAESDFAGFVCECGDADCEMTVRLELAAYEHIRRDPCLFFVVPGHELADAEAVVERNERYLVVRKLEDAADIAEDLDPRG